jgi:MinD-like ATPase involved in chromosome partitioning or flagellar assembly
VLIALVSAKGAPGVTTGAVALTAIAAQRGPAVLVEADPAGGDLECWTGPHGEPGLVAVATDLRREVTPESLLEHAVEICSGVRAVAGPTSEAASTAALAGATDRLGPALAALDGTAVLDAGRWSPFQRTHRHVAAAGVVGILCRPTVDGVEHASALLEVLRPVNRSVALVLAGGDKPYGPAEISAVLDAPVAGVLAWDPRGVLALLTSGVSRAWLRTACARSAQSTLDGLEHVAAEAWAHA